MSLAENFDHSNLDKDESGKLLFFMLTGIGNEYEKLIRLLLKNDPDFVFDEDGETVLFERPLLEVRDINLETPLLTAFKNNELRTINLLLQYGAKSDVVDLGGNTTLINVCLNETLSVELYRTVILKNLILRGANYKARNQNLEDFLSLLPDKQRRDMEEFIGTYKK